MSGADDTDHRRAATTREPAAFRRPPFNAAVARVLGRAVDGARPSAGLGEMIQRRTEGDDVVVLLSIADDAAAPLALRRRVAAAIGVGAVT